MQEHYSVILDRDEDTGYGRMEGWPRETWYNEGGEVHRSNGSAVTVMDGDDPTLVARQEWLLQGQHHRDNEPAVIRFSPNGKVEQEEWYQHGKLHREDGPAFLQVDTGTGLVLQEAWYLNGRLHRVDQPAKRLRDPWSGVTYVEVWASHGNYHRVGKPALIGRHEDDGTIEYAEYYENGNKLNSVNEPSTPEG